MDDDGDLHEQILHIEAYIEELTAVMQSCRKIILISKAAIAAGGTLIVAIIIGAVRFDLLVFEPKTTVPPITAAIAPIMTVGSKPTAPMIIAKIKVPPAAIAAFEIRMIFRQLCMTAVSSSM